jgi:PLP dependent protein
MMATLAERLHKVEQRLRSAERAAERVSGCVRLLAVSKTKPAEQLIRAYRAGQRHFGESYLQEALVKQQQLAHFNITWHFIGPIQSNKTRSIANHFNWVHSVDRVKIARRLDEQRSPERAPLNICLQVNVSGEMSKSGVSLDELPELAAAVSELPRLRLRGLMSIPAQTTDFDNQRAAFWALRIAMEKLPYSTLDTLSIGMSNDLEAAVAEGATIVRIGTALFGSRS